MNKEIQELQELVNKVWGHVLHLVDALEELEAKIACLSNET